jgi:hypothetical protein
MKRRKFQELRVYLRDRRQDEYLAKTVPQLPHDPENPLEIIIREKPRKRKLDANAAYWAGPIADIERQVWHQGRQYPGEEWHEGFKALFLPDENDPWVQPGQDWEPGLFDPSHVVDPDTYQKWTINPITGNRTVKGSTTQLTDPGMHAFRVQVEAFASQTFGVEFTTREEVPAPIATRRNVA